VDDARAINCILRVKQYDNSLKDKFDTTWIVGIRFFKQFYTIYDSANNKIGIVDSIEQDKDIKHDEINNVVIIIIVCISSLCCVGIACIIFWTWKKKKAMKHEDLEKSSSFNYIKDQVGK